MVRKLVSTDIDDLAYGCAVLGTGGGGDPHIGKLMVKQVINDGKEISLYSVDEVDDKDWILPVAMMGAPVIMIEKLPSGTESVNAMNFFEHEMKKKISFISPIEAGGVNSTIPLFVGAMTNKRVVDGDGEGRAFPELQMVTYHLYDIKASPIVMYDEKGNVNVVQAVNNIWGEKIARSVTIRFGGSAYISLYYCDGESYHKATIPGTIAKSIEIGQRVREAKKEGKEQFDALLDVAEAKHLFTGKIVDLERKVEKGFARGKITIDGTEEFSGRTASIDFQNENLILREEEKVIASVPDLITVIDSESSTPITTEHLRYGLRIKVIGIKCDSKWRTKKGLETVGPKYFGYDINYKPL